MASSVIASRGQVAAFSRSRTPDDPALIEARRQLAAAKIEQYIERVVAEAPPLSPEQRSRLVAILRGGEAS